MELSQSTMQSGFELAQSVRTPALPDEAGGDFGALLQDRLKAQGDLDHSPEHVRKVAGDLVAQALILPILKQVRRGTFGKNTPFSPGTGEKTFGPEFDIQIADRIAHSPRMGPTDAIAARLMQRYSAEAETKTGAGPKKNENIGVDVHG